MASSVSRSKPGNHYSISLFIASSSSSRVSSYLIDLNLNVADTMISGRITSKLVMLSAARQLKLFSLVGIRRKYSLTTNSLQHVIIFDVILDGGENLERTS